MPSEPMLLVSLRNRYILKCIDGLAVDAKSTGTMNMQNISDMFQLQFILTHIQGCQAAYIDRCISEITGLVPSSRVTLAG
jgi:hypothetical protein